MLVLYYSNAQFSSDEAKMPWLPVRGAVSHGRILEFCFYSENDFIQNFQKCQRRAQPKRGRALLTAPAWP
jgi:hypothetical protein